MTAPRRGWRYFATRLNGDGTETMLHTDLPLESVEVDDVLSGDNGLSGTISPAYASMMADDGVPLLTEWGTAVYAEVDGEIRGGGILNHSEFDGPQWSLECVGFTGYARGMPWTSGTPVTNNPPGWTIAAGKDGSGLGVQVDPIDMVRVIWKQIQGSVGGNIGLVWDTTTGGKKIGLPLTLVDPGDNSTYTYESGPYKLNWYTNLDLAGEIDSLAASTPFDYHERHYWDGDTIKHFVDIGYPKLGQRRDDLRFQYGVNAFEIPSVTRDGENYASGVLVLGNGDGPAMQHIISEPPARPPGRLRRVAVVQDDTLKTAANLQSRAAAELQWRRNLDDITEITVVDHPNAPLGSVSVGDEIRIEGRSDWVNVDQWVRVLSISIEPENGKVAQYTIARTDKLTTGGTTVN